MKIKLLFLFIFITAFVNAQTVVGGSISSNATWNLAGSPYLVQSNVAVMTGVTLTIDPGVVVKFDSQKSIQFFGTLRALGTQSQPITFTSGVVTPNPGDWGYILFNSSSPSYNFSNGTGSIMQYCIVEYAGGANVPFNGVVRMNNSFPYLNNCTIQNNAMPAIKAWNLSSTLFIDSTKIQFNNVDTGAVYASSGTLSMYRCNISNNNTSLVTTNNYSVAGIFTKDAAMRVNNCTLNANNSRAIAGYKSGNNAQTDSITLNIIMNNLKDGVAFFPFSSGYVQNKTFFILNNTITGNAGNGIYDWTFFNHKMYSNFFITGNTISNNTGNGISIYFDNSMGPGNITYTIANNLVNNNGANGIYFYNYGTTVSNAYNITDNTINKNTGKGIYFNQINYAIYSNSYSVKRNIINKNQAGGISFSFANSTNNTMPPINIILEKNKVINNSGILGSGISVLSYNAFLPYDACQISLTLLQNVIAGNMASNQGGGIYLNFPDTIINVISKNTSINNFAPTSSAIYYKGKGILQANKNTIVFNKTTGNDSLRMVYLKETQSFNNNNIYNGICDSPIVLWYDDFNGNTLNAQSCYWKQVTTSGIDNVIWDYFDDQNLAIVDPSNFETSPDTAAPVTPVENIVKTNLGGGNIQLDWSPNLESDLAGYKIYWGSPTGYSFANMVNAGNVTTYTISPASMSDTIAVTAFDTQANGTDDQVEGHESWFSEGDTCDSAPVGIFSYNNAISISAFPNPSTGIFTLQSSDPSALLRMTSIEIINVLGEEIYSSDALHSPSMTNRKIEIDLRKQPKGIYIYEVIGEEGVIGKGKLVVR